MLLVHPLPGWQLECRFFMHSVYILQSLQKQKNPLARSPLSSFLPFLRPAFFAAFFSPLPSLSSVERLKLFVPKNLFSFFLFSPLFLQLLSRAEAPRPADRPTDRRGTRDLPLPRPSQLHLVLMFVVSLTSSSPPSPSLRTDKPPRTCEQRLIAALRSDLLPLEPLAHPFPSVPRPFFARPSLEIHQSVKNPFSR